MENTKNGISRESYFLENLSITLPATCCYVMRKIQLAIHGHIDVSQFDTKDVRTVWNVTDSDG
jgi:hypothetical protein